MTTKNMFNFKIIKRDKKSKARAGEIITAHGIVKTPAFVPVGTKATVKGMTPLDLKEIGAEILFANTYHLHLSPGEDTVKEFGGIGKFMGWDGPTITDSGGFQVFSLGQIVPRGPVAGFPPAFAEASAGRPASDKALPAPFDGVGNPSIRATPLEPKENPRLVKITEDGVEFRSHVDGSLHTFTPEKSIEIQKKLGADIILAFDECAPHPSTHEYAKEAMQRTHSWSIRSLEAHRRHPEFISGSPASRQASLPSNEMLKQVQHDKERWEQALYGIIQGGVYKDLREESAKFISNLPFDGIAIGGVSVGESKKEMRDVLDWTVPLLTDDKPRHLLGIGEIDDIFEAIERGIDTFDCVIPTRFGRYGIVSVGPPEGGIDNRFRINLNKVTFAKDKSPIAKDCPCYTCQNFTRGYLHHLFRANELLAYRLASFHNLYFLVNLVKDIRKSIISGNFQKMKKDWLV